jgi:bifunctional non-homologous end joining protein LigD
MNAGQLLGNRYPDLRSLPPYVAGVSEGHPHRQALPLLKRKAALQKELTRTERIVYCQHIGESGEKLFQAADQLGLKGVIGEKADGHYRAGRTSNWSR